MDKDLSKATFDRDGFVRVAGFYTSSQVENVLANLDRYVRDVVPRISDTDAFYEDQDNPATLKQVIRLDEHDGYFRDLFQSGSLPEMAAVLLGEQVRPITQQVFIKPPGGLSKPTPAHQDGFYFHIDPCSALTLWLALDDIDEENGCLRFVRGSHVEGLRQHERTRTLGFSQGLPDFGGQDDLAAELPCTARAGDLIAHHAMTIHRAGENCAAERRRRALGLIYYGDSAQERTEEHEAYRQELNADLRQSGKI